MPLLLILLVFGWIPVRAEDAPLRQEAMLVKNYQGTHLAEFTAQFDRVRILTHQAQLEVSSRLGLLQYRQGFKYPIQIRFEDGAPQGLESALAYVRYSTGGNDFQQEMVVNLVEITAHPMDFDTVFYHEMTHAVMNDAVGGEATLYIPHWLQEGLAIWVSGEGDARVKQSAQRLRKSQVERLVFPLDGSVYGQAYPQYYLAIKYLLDTYSINAVQGIIRQLIEQKPLETAIQDSTGLTWEQYQTNVKTYSLKIFKDLALPDGVLNPL